MSFVLPSSEGKTASEEDLQQLFQFAAMDRSIDAQVASPQLSLKELSKPVLEQKRTQTTARKRCLKRRSLLKVSMVASDQAWQG